MFTFIDKQLDKVTMYRLTLYYVIFILSSAVLLGAIGVLHYSPYSILYSSAFFLFFCVVANDLFSWAFNVVSNDDSVYITALILTALITPPASVIDGKYYTIALWTAIWAMASKYIFAIKKRHIFNPAAFAIFFVSLTLGLSAVWWVGTPALLPFVIIGGLLLVRKIGRFDLVLTFIAVAFLSIVIPQTISGSNFLNVAMRAFGNSPIFFFAFVMLTEPLTSPPTKKMRMIFAAVIGVIFAPWVHIANFYSTPELSLLIGNLGSYFVSAKENLLLVLKKINILSADTAELVFASPQRLRFQSGQYMEMMLPHENSDTRGIRRYLTLSSSPTEDDIMIGVRFCDNGSTYKKTLLSMEIGDTITAAHLIGDFVLPPDPKQKLVFVAHNIGITPFRSMIKFMMDKGEKRDIILIYSNKTEGDIAYKNILDEAQLKIGLRTVYVYSEIDKKTIEQNIPDYRERLFYVAGPLSSVIAQDKILKGMGINDSRIKKSFFPGFKD